MRRLTALLLALFIAASFSVTAEEAPLTLPSATSVEEVMNFILMPPEDGIAPVQKGCIRYIGQNEERDNNFREEYWMGGKKGSILDLTITERQGEKLAFHAGIMCTRAAYSMMLSYFGIDMSPGEMSRVTGARNLYEPYANISELVGVEQVTVDPPVFNNMVQNYLTDDSYSPVYLYIQRPNGSCHSLLVIATIPEKGRYLVIDSNPIQSKGQLYPVYFISLNKNRSEIINSTFRRELVGSKVLKVHQWRLTGGEPAAE